MCGIIVAVIFIERHNSLQKKIAFEVESDLIKLNDRLKLILNLNENELTNNLEKYLLSSSKKLRPILIFLLVKALGKNVLDSHIKIASSVELIHNATLIHDDIIDGSALRRGNKSLNYEFDNKLAVVAGDYLLALALDELLNVGSIDVLKLFTSSLSHVCEGEINQYFQKGKVVDIESYIDRSKQKTAILFQVALESIILLSCELDHLNAVRTFAINFGIAFQIKDDLTNVLHTDLSKPAFNDYLSGTYTAPIIFLAQFNENYASIEPNKLLQTLKTSGAIEQTKILINKHINLAIDSLSFLDDNCSKRSIIEICRSLG